jgi:hypothetical protein
MATSIFFGGRRINIPGAYSRLDVSGLSTVSPAAVGIVALIGTAEGGKPLSIAPEDSDHTRSDSLITRYRPGSPLRTAGFFAFEPANDDAIPGGAQRIVAVKVNPATQSQVTLNDANNDPAVVLTSRDYGLFTTQINVDVQPGTNTGKLITLVFEDQTESFDDVGGDAKLTVQYTPGAEGYTGVTALFGTTDFRANGTKASPGLDSQRSADITPPGIVEYLSSAAGDTTQQVTVYGLDSSNNPIVETRTLNGTTPVAGSATFASVLGCVKSAATAGTITVRSTVPVTLFTLPPAVLTRGMVVMTNAPIVPSASTIAIDVGSPGANAIVVTTAASGAELMQRVDLSSATPITLTGAGTRLKYLVLGDVPAARTVTLAVRLFTLLYATFSTVQRIVDAVNVLPGLLATPLASNPTTFLSRDMDRATAVSIQAIAGEFFADLYEFIVALNTGSLLVSAERVAAPNGRLVPANLTAPVYLTGGSEGTPTINEWQQAFRLLRERRVNIIVPLTRDPAVHALLNQHLRLRAGTLRSEANGYIGLAKADGSGETRANLKSQIVAIQSRSISAVAQEVQRFDPDTGERKWFSPIYHAAICAGAQAGSPIGEPLTHKKPFVLDIRNDPSWSVVDDAEEMIDAGLMFAEKREGEGIRWVRSITTHIADNNPIYTEMSANESADQFAYQFRSALEQRIGRRSLAGSAGAIKGLANDVASRLVDDEVIVAFRALQVDQIGDTFPVSIEIAPVEPTNFIPITIHLTRFRAAA